MKSDQYEQRALGIIAAWVNRTSGEWTSDHDELEQAITAALREAEGAAKDWEKAAIDLSDQRAKLWTERDALRAQLTAAQAENERLREAAQFAWDWWHLTSDELEARYEQRHMLDELRAALAPRDAAGG